MHDDSLSQQNLKEMTSRWSIGGLHCERDSYEAMQVAGGQQDIEG